MIHSFTNMQIRLDVILLKFFKEFSNIRIEYFPRTDKKRHILKNADISKNGTDHIVCCWNIICPNLSHIG